MHYLLCFIYIKCFVRGRLDSVGILHLDWNLEPEAVVIFLIARVRIVDQGFSESISGLYLGEDLVRSLVERHLLWFFFLLLVLQGETGEPGGSTRAVRGACRVYTLPVVGQ